jgi:hypothetical protein
VGLSDGTRLTLRSIRELLVIVHQSWFFEGDIHHEKKEEEQEGEFDAPPHDE